MHITYSLLFSIPLKIYRELDGSNCLLQVVTSIERWEGEALVPFLKLGIYRALSRVTASQWYNKLTMY